MTSVLLHVQTELQQFPERRLIEEKKKLLLESVI
jgi:hypothetical protein